MYVNPFYNIVIAQILAQMLAQIIALAVVLGNALLLTVIGVVLCALSALLVIEPALGVFALLIGIIYYC
jgi:hypothetical protein